jgi:hypothetical protein
MNPISFSKREKCVFIFTIVFIAAALLCNFIFESGIRKWQALDNEIADRNIRMDKDIRLIERRGDISQEYNRYNKYTNNLSMVLRDIEQYADSFGIKTSNIKPSQPIEKGLYEEYIVELQIEGGMSDIIKFLATVIKAPTFAVLKKFDFKLISQNPSVFKGTIMLSKIII